MVSRMALICKRYAAECTKTKAEILRSQNARKEKTHPEMYALSDFLIMVFVMVSEAVT